MEINIGNKTVISIAFSEIENAWKIEDAISVIEYLHKKNQIVLGGDILNEKLEHTYDSWYYNLVPNQNKQFNIDNSIKLAIDYISNYVRLNGNAFYVVFVIA